MNQLFFGDNLHVLRESVANESVDLIYLDPPFNSKRDDNLLFKSPVASGKKFPRLQLLTIEGLLSGKQRAGHPDHQPDLNFKKARAESNAAQKKLI